MNLCDKKHDEVCFEGRTCPVCALRIELEDRIAEERKEVLRLAQEVASLEGEVSSLERKLAEPLIPAMEKANGNTTT